MRPPYVTAEILPNGNMKIVPSEFCKGDLAEALANDPDQFDRDDLMHDVLSPLVENGEYEWTRPEFCGALTSAPMLAVYGEEIPLPEGADSRYFNVVYSGRGATHYAPVEKCWGYMEYAITSPQREMLERGFCIFTSGQMTEALG
jgi:hypothetical protein